ncbi:MAG: phage portal protein [Muribaculaceae bacterium]
MALSSVYRCVDIIADNIALIPIKLKDRQKDHISEVYNHPLNLIFENKTKSNYSMFQLVRLLIQSVLLNGNGFAYIQRNNKGDVVGLKYLPSSTVTISYNEQTGSLLYSSTLIQGGAIEPINMIHLLKYSTDGVNGKSVISAANSIISNATLCEAQTAEYLESGFNKQGIIKVQGQVNDKQSNEILSKYRNAFRAGGDGVAVFQGNMDFVPIQISPSESQIIEQKKYNTEDIARFFGIPIELLQANTLSSSQLQQKLMMTLMPYIQMIEEEFNRKLIKPLSEHSLYIEFDTTNFIRYNDTEIASYYASLLDKGILCINEVRKELGYNPIEGGDKHIMAYTDIEQNTINKTEKPNENEDTTAE